MKDDVATSRAIPGSLLLVALTWLAAKCAFNATHGLVPDEAYYWVWTRHPDWSYFDHPPMVAWMIRLGTLIAGTNEFGVRVMSVIGLLVATFVLFAACRRWIGDRRWHTLTLSALLFSPPIAVAATVTTPDTFALAFQMLALAAVIRIVEGKAKTIWLLAGLALGGAMLSKYTSVLFALSTFLTFLTDARLRKTLATPWPYLGVVIASWCFLPVTYWNLVHDFASFKFQLGRDSDPISLGKRFAFFAEYIGGQLVTLGGVLNVVGIVCLTRVARRWRDADSIDRLFFWSAVVPFGFFLVMSFKGRVQLNWPAFATVPMTLIVVRDLMKRRELSRDNASLGDQSRRFMAPDVTTLACMIAIGAGVAIHLVPALLWRAKVKLPTDQLFGSREWAHQIDARKTQLHAPLLAGRYQDAALASFYLPGRPEVWAMNFGDSRRNAYDFWPGKPDLAALDRVLYLGKPEAELRDRFADVTTEEVPIVVAGRTLRKLYLVTALSPRTPPRSVNEAAAPPATQP